MRQSGDDGIKRPGMAVDGLDSRLFGPVDPEKMGRFLDGGYIVGGGATASGSEHSQAVRPVVKGRFRSEGRRRGTAPRRSPSLRGCLPAVSV